MTDQLPAEVSEDDDYPKQAKQMFAKLAMVVNTYTGDRARNRGLVLFEDRENGNAPPRPRSQVRANDTPQTELILYHRDHIRRLKQGIESLRTHLAEQIKIKSNEGLLRCAEEVTKWEAQHLKHCQMLESLLDNQTDQLSGKESMMAKLASDQAYLTQKAAEHKDKMDLANKTNAIPTTLELKQRLALKYGVPIEQVEAILAAKQIDAEPADG